MAYTLHTAATSEPISLSETKLWLKVDSSCDDDLISALITTARQHCESVLNRQLVSATWKLYLDEFPDVIELRKCPVASVSSITYVDSAGATQTLSSSDYIVDTISEPARITPAYNEVWPVVQSRINTVIVTFVAGYSTVPETIQTAMKLLIGHWYENRESVAVGTIATEIPMAVKSLLASVSWGNYCGVS